MFLSVRELELHKVRFDVAFAQGQFDFLDKWIRQAEPLEVSGEAELLASIQEIRVRGHVRGRIECDCDRCLENAAFPIDRGFDLLYRPDEVPAACQEVRISKGESEIGFYEGGGLELADIVREQILLWLPMQRLCTPECKGICPSCGANRNMDICGCEPRESDSRWAALRQMI